MRTEQGNTLINLKLYNLTPKINQKKTPKKLNKESSCALAPPNRKCKIPPKTKRDKYLKFCQELAGTKHRFLFLASKGRW